MRPLLTLFGIACALIGLGHVFLGPGVIPGSVPVNATMDSEDRFYATLFIGFGLACAWAARDIPARAAALAMLMAVFFAGGVARLISWAMAGPPHPLFIVLAAVELTLPVAVLAWLRRQGHLRR